MINSSLFHGNTAILLLDFFFFFLDLAFIIKAGAESQRFDRNKERLSLSGKEIDVE